MLANILMPGSRTAKMATNNNNMLSNILSGEKTMPATSNDGQYRPSVMRPLETLAKFLPIL